MSKNTVSSNIPNVPGIVKNSGTSGFSAATDGSYPNLVYGNSTSFLASTRFFTDSGLTTPFNGGGYYYMDSTFENSCTITINSSGYNTCTYCC